MKVKIKIDILGHLPHSSEIESIKNWRSDLFEITRVDKYDIVGSSDGADWSFSDKNIEKQLRGRDGSDVLIAVTNVPLQDGYFARGFSDDRLCITYFGMSEILTFNDIPLENLLLRVLYAVAFVYRRSGNTIPSINVWSSFTHDDTRGCVFDMDGANKADVIYSTNKPQLCSSCVQSLTNNPVANNRIEKNLIEKVQVELLGIDKGLYYEIADWIKRHPVYAIIISSLTAITLEVISHFVYEKIK